MTYNVFGGMLNLALSILTEKKLHCRTLHSRCQQLLSSYFCNQLITL